MSRYEEDNVYIDGEDRKPRLFLVLGIIILIVIILVIVISCGMKTKSNNNYLMSLRVSNSTMTPEFNKNNTTYDIVSDNDFVTVYCSSESSKARTLGCNKTVDLIETSTTHKITVTAEDKTVRVYTLNITKNKAEEVKPVVSISSSVESGKEVEDKLLLESTVTPSDIVVNYEWYKDDTLIEGATYSTYEVKTSGNYYVKIVNKELNIDVESNLFVVKIKKKNTTNTSSNNNNNNNNVNNKNNNSSSNSNNSYTLKINNITGNSSSWTNKVTLKVSATASRGLANKAYSFDGGKTYQSSNTKTFTKNGSVVVVVKDSKGKTISKKIEITKIDTTKPNVSISASNKTNTSVLLTAKVDPKTTASGYSYQWYKDGEIIKNANNNTYKVTSTGTYKVKVTTGSGNSVTSSNYSFKVIKVTCPTLTVTTESGKNVVPNTWYGEVIYVKIVPSGETVSYDVYLNQDGNYENISKTFNYFNTFTGSVKVRIVNGGMRVLKIVVRDKFGNTNTCYSNAYYLR